MNILTMILLQPWDRSLLPALLREPEMIFPVIAARLTVRAARDINVEPEVLQQLAKRANRTEVGLARMNRAVTLVTQYRWQGDNARGDPFPLPVFGSKLASIIPFWTYELSNSVPCGCLSSDDRYPRWRANTIGVELAKSTPCLASRSMFGVPMEITAGCFSG